MFIAERILYDMYKDSPDNDGNTEITDLDYRPPPDFNDEILIDSNLNNLQETQKKELVLNNYNFYKFYYINFDDNMYEDLM